MSDPRRKRASNVVASMLLIVVCAACTDSKATDAGASESHGALDGAVTNMKADSGPGADDRDGGSVATHDHDGAAPTGTTSCSVASDCPHLSSLGPCEQPVCNAGACDVAPVAAGTRLEAQTAGDCRAAVCDAAGDVASIDDDDDVPEDDGNDCTADGCNAGSSQHLPEPSGTTCAMDGGKVCDGHGACVECVLPSECTTNVCQDGACRPAICDNGMLDTGESDVDCGGDCGGCAPEQMCGADGDCVGMECALGACVPNCADKVTNHGESAEDCGAVCPASLCGNGKHCATDADCDSGWCDATSDTCATPSCTDSVQNGTETGVDCGGASAGVTCPACVVPCNDNWECDGVFGAGVGLCYEHACTDSVNGCTLANATDMTGMVTASLSTPIQVQFGGTVGINYSPRCLKVTMGTQVEFSGAFATHPLVGGVVDGGAKVPASAGFFTPKTNTGTSKVFTLDDCGAYPYYCDVHALSGMTGAVIVLQP